MASGIRGFVAVFVAVSTVLFIIAAFLATLLHQGLLIIAVQVYFWIGIGYIAASTLAWSGVANMYRYSPTLFAGSKNYRQEVVRPQVWREGRDDRAFLVGLSFGGALLGLAAALYSPIMALVDVLIIAAVVGVVYLRQTRTVLKA